MRKAVLAVIMTLLIPIAALAQGYGPGGGGPGMRGPGGPVKGSKLIDELNLSEEQLKKAKEIQGKQRKAIIDLKAAQQKAMIDLTEELQKEKPDKAALDKIIDTIVKTKGEMERSRLNIMVEMSGLLTPEQKKKAADRMIGTHFMGGGMGGPGQGGPMGNPGAGGPRGGRGPGAGPANCPDCPFNQGGQGGPEDAE